MSSLQTLIRATDAALKVAQRLTIVQRAIERLVGRAVPLLNTAHARHLGHAGRFSTHAPALEVQRLNHRDQPRSGRDTAPPRQGIPRSVWASSLRARRWQKRRWLIVVRTSSVIQRIAQRLRERDDVTREVKAPRVDGMISVGRANRTN